MPEWRLRSACSGDAAGLSELALGLADCLSEPGQTLPPELSLALGVEAFAKRLADPAFVTSVALGGDQLIGMVSVRDGDYLYHLLVHERWQRRGLGRQLWQTAVSDTDAAEIRWRSSLYAVPAYLRLGAEFDGPEVSFKNTRFQPMRWRCSPVG